MPLPETQLCWIYRGQGMASFGADSQPERRPVPRPGPGEVLARVEAFSICASDVKMVVMGNDYPLFKDRDFDRSPAVLGHELSLTVAESGPDMAEQWPVGKRFGVQPDVWLNRERFCIGVNVTGGMAEYVLLGKEVFTSDQGCCAFAINEPISDAALSQTEPLACVEAAFVQHSRQQMKPNGRLLIWLDPETNVDFRLDLPLVADHVLIIGQKEHFTRYVSGDLLPDTHFQDRLPKETFDDIIILGNPDTATLSELTERMAVNGLLCWLPAAAPVAHIPADIAKIHYNVVNLLGSPLRRLSGAFNDREYRYDYQPGGTLLLSGGGGTMGRIHLQRALKSQRKPANIIITGNTSTRLTRMAEDFSSLIADSGVSVHFIASKETSEFAQRIRQWVGEQGASDIIVCAPGIEPLSDVVEFLADDGTLVLFSGTRYGQFGPLPLGKVAWSNATITASSGSSVQDQLRVLEKINRGEALPDFNVAAIGGLLATKEGLEAVQSGRFAGKVVIYPELHTLPLIALDDLALWDPALGAQVKAQGWSLQAEQALRERYTQQQK